MCWPFFNKRFRSVDLFTMKRIQYFQALQDPPWPSPEALHFALFKESSKAHLFSFRVCFFAPLLRLQCLCQPSLCLWHWAMFLLAVSAVHLRKLHNKICLSDQGMIRTKKNITWMHESVLDTSSLLLLWPWWDLQTHRLLAAIRLRLYVKKKKKHPRGH